MRLYLGLGGWAWKGQCLLSEYLSGNMISQPNHLGHLIVLPKGPRVPDKVLECANNNGNYTNASVSKKSNVVFNEDFNNRLAMRQQLSQMLVLTELLLVRAQK